METVGIFYGHLVYLHTTIWFIVHQCGIICSHLTYLDPFWYAVPTKNMVTQLVGSAEHVHMCIPMYTYIYMYTTNTFVPQF
jgi:hypothetical protein